MILRPNDPQFEALYKLYLREGKPAEVTYDNLRWKHITDNDTIYFVTVGSAASFDDKYAQNSFR